MGSRRKTGGAVARLPWIFERGQRWRWRHWRLWRGGALDPSDTLQVYTYAITGLRQTTRDVFLLHRLEAMDCSTIGRVLRLPVFVVEARLSAALFQISRTLDLIEEARPE